MLCYNITLIQSNLSMVKMRIPIQDYCLHRLGIVGVLMRAYRQYG